MKHQIACCLLVCSALTFVGRTNAQLPANPYTATVGPAYGYTAQGKRAEFYSIAGKPDTLYYPFGGGLATPEDDGYATLSLPFNFRFFNQIIPAGNPIFVSANGYLLFGTSSTTVVPTNLLTEPASFGNQQAISPFFTDLIARGQQPGGPGLYVQTTGSADNRRLTIEWSSMQHYNNGQPSNVVSFQVCLFEASDTMLFNYSTTMFGTEADGGKMATVGIRDTTFNDPPDNVLQWGYLAGTPGGSGIGLGDSNFQIEFNHFAAIPEPTSIALSMMGSAGLAGAIWYRRRQRLRRTKTASRK